MMLSNRLRIVITGAERSVRLSAPKVNGRGSTANTVHGEKLRTQNVRRTKINSKSAASTFRVTTRTTAFEPLNVLYACVGCVNESKLTC